MDVRKHYKMFKKGKKWCCMALTTVAVAAGTVMATQTANADTAVETGNAVVSTTSEVPSASANTSGSATSNESAASAMSSTTITNQASVSSTENIASAVSESANIISQSVADDANSQSSVANTANDSAASVLEITESTSSASASTNSDTAVKEASTDSNDSESSAVSSAVADTENIAMTSLAVAAEKDGLVTENGNTYYYQNGQQLKDNFATINGKTYYFKANGTMATDYFYQNWGHTYYFQKDGSRLDNGFYTNWGNVYYFGDGGVRLDNSFYTNWGKVYYFGADGARVTNATINLGFGDLTFDGNGVLSDSNSFIGSIVNGAIRGWTQYKILPSLTLAQAILESGWGKSTLASQYHNLFGIKGSYNGQSVTMATAEFIGGRYITVNAAFRAYPDNDASVADHSLFLIQNSRYSNLIGVTNSNNATKWIREDGYATDPSYTTSLRNMISTYNLTRFDQVAFRL